MNVQVPDRNNNSPVTLADPQTQNHGLFEYD